MAAATPRLRIAVRFGLVAGLAMLALAGAWVVRAIPPEGSGLYPPCLLHAMTGLHCPGCGGTRSLHALLHGEFTQAFAWNPIAPVGLPILALLMGLAVRSAVGGTLPRFRGPSNWWYVGSVVLLVVFFLVRNIPAHPFTLLAPHRL